MIQPEYKLNRRHFAIAKRLMEDPEFCELLAIVCAKQEQETLESMSNSLLNNDVNCAMRFTGYHQAVQDFFSTFKRLASATPPVE